MWQDDKTLQPQIEEQNEAWDLIFWELVEVLKIREILNFLIKVLRKMGEKFG